MSVNRTFNDPSLHRIAKRTGIRRCGQGFEIALETLMVNLTRTIVERLVVLCRYQNVHTATPQQLKIVLKCMNIKIAIPNRANVSSLKPFNSRKKITAKKAVKAKATKRPEALQSAYLDRLMIPMKNFDSFCRKIVTTFVNSSDKTVTLRYEAATVPLIQFCVERIAQNVCFIAMNFALFSKRDTVYANDVLAAHNMLVKFWA